MKKLILICLLCLVVQAGIAEEIKENDAWKLERIDSATFYAAKKRVNPKPQQKARKITDVEEIKKLLAPRGFKFVTDKWENEEGETREATYMYYPIKGKFYKEFAAHYDPAINFHPESLEYKKDGYLYYGDEHLGLCIGSWGAENESSVYFPSEDIFIAYVLGDYIYNFRTDSSPMGHPDCWLFSPSKTYLLNMAYDGNDEYNWFVQKRVSPGHYINFTGDLPIFLFWLEDAFWDGDQILYLLENRSNYDEENDDTYSCYRLTIK